LRAAAKNCTPWPKISILLSFLHLGFFLCGCWCSSSSALVVLILYKQIWTAFLANPGLNALIIGVLVIGIALAFRQVIRLFPEVSWVNGFRLADPGIAVERPPVLLAPMAVLLGDRIGRMAISSQLMRGILDSIATRLDEARDMSRYMTGLRLLGLLGTFWGPIETMGSIGNAINTLKPGGDAAIFDSLKEALPFRWAECIAFSSSPFGLAASLVLVSRSPDEPAQTGSTPISRIGCPPRCAISSSTVRARQARRRARFRGISKARSTACGMWSQKADRAGRPQPPWPISRKPFRGWSSTCARSSR
jgi:hypothetical protein